MTEQRVRVAQDTGARVVIFEHVPAWVCGQCGERAFRAAVVIELERLDDGARPPDRIEQVPVYDLAGVPLELAATTER
jgi:YgiT-type zinc finger domain-containing protein